MEEAQALVALSQSLLGRRVDPSRLGRYELRRRLGAGASGVVYEGWDPKLERPVALKILRGRYSEHPLVRERFQREARALARLDHPAVVRIFDVGDEQGQAGETHFIVMEKVDGETLDTWARGRRWKALVGAMIQAGEGLAAAHAAGLLHRDFKPTNVLITEDGKAKVLDFGLARPRASSEEEQTVAMPEDAGSDHGITRHGTVLGTVTYMPPEQLTGEVVDPAADQYAFASSLAELLVGRGQLEEVRAGNLRGLPAPLRAPLSRALSHDKEARFPSMDALLRRLRLARLGDVGLAGLAGFVLIGVATVMGLATQRSAEPTLACDAVVAGVGVEPSGETASGLEGAMGERVGRELARYEQSVQTGLETVCEDGNARCVGDALVAYDAARQALAQSSRASERGAALISGLPDPRRCNARVDDVPVSIRGRLHRVEALRQLGEAKPALELSGQIVDSLEGTDGAAWGYAQLAMGWALIINDDIEGGKQAHVAALERGRATGADVLVAQAANALLRPATGEQVAPLAEEARAAIERLGGDASLEAILEERLGTAAIAEQDFDAAETHMRAAIKLWESEVGTDDLRLVPPLQNLAIIPLLRGEQPSARTFERLERALQIRIDHQGQAHPTTILTGLNLGSAYIMGGQLDDARVAFENALAAATRAEGDHSSLAGTAMSNLAEVALQQGELQVAQAHAAEALAIFETLEGDATDKVVRVTYAQILIENGAYEAAQEQLDTLDEREQLPARVLEERGWLALAEGKASREHFAAAEAGAAKTYGPDSDYVAKARLGRFISGEDLELESVGRVPARMARPWLAAIDTRRCGEAEERQALTQAIGTAGWSADMADRAIALSNACAK